MRRTSLHLALACALLVAAPSGAMAATIGTTNGDPDRGCDDCTVVSRAAAASGTTITSFNLRHSGSVAGAQVAFKTLREDGFSSYTVVRSTGLLALPAASSPTTTTFAIPDGLPIAAGELIGVYVSNAGAGPVNVVASGGSAGYATQSGNVAPGSSGENFWAVFSAGDLLLSGTDGSGSSGTGSPGGGDSGGGDGSGGGGSSYCQSPTASPARVASAGSAPVARPALRTGGGARTARRQWRGQVLDRSSSSRGYLQARIELDRRGRRHVIGKELNPVEINYFGPGRRRGVGETDFSPDVALAVTPAGRATAAYSRTMFEGTGACEVLFLAAAPGFAAQPLAVRPGNDPGYLFKDIAADPSGRGIHAAYNVGRKDVLIYQRVGAAPERLPLSGVRRVRVAAGPRGQVAVAASNDSRLVVFTRKGRGRWKSRTIGRRVGSWDMDVGRDGQPRVAFKSGLYLRLFNGKRVVRTRLFVDQVALAVDRRKQLHVAFTKVGGPNCFGYIRRDTCVSNGIFHLRTNSSASRGRIQVVQRSVGQSPPLSIAVSGRKIEVAFPQAGGALYVRRR